MRLFLEFDYTHANTKNINKTRFLVSTLTGAPPGTLVNFAISNYRLCDTAIGAQYHLKQCDDDPIALFIGAKTGLSWHNNINIALSQHLDVPGDILHLIPASDNKKIFLSALSPLAGLQIGFNFNIAESWNFALTGEIIGTCGPKCVETIKLSPNFDIGGVTHALLSPIHAELRLPITASIQYNF